MSFAGPIARADEEDPAPPFRWGPYLAHAVVVAAATAVGTKLGEWAVEEVRAWWQRSKEPKA